MSLQIESSHFPDPILDKMPATEHPNKTPNPIIPVGIFFVLKL